MRRTVLWVTSAEGELAEIWMASFSRNDVAAASQSIDARLTDDAESNGVRLSEGLWAIEESPVRVIYEILDDDRVVRILKVKLCS